MDTNAQAAPGVGQEPALDITKLPVSHTPKFLAEAKRIYENKKPPFVTSATSNSEGSKRPVFIAKNGQRPPLPIRTDLVAKFWGQRFSDGIYWTLDLNGERLIVVSFPNKGCVSGAKWVYCCWTGVGEEFEDLPVAFSCINGDYTNTLGSRRESTGAVRESTIDEDTSSSATPNNLDLDHPPKFTPLPDDHPVEHLDEAKTLYVDTTPPFTILKKRNRRRRVLLAMQNGRFSATSTEAEVVYRDWDAVTVYPSLDLDGKRFIVSGNPGGHPGGYQYHLWLGSQIGRVQKVAAYSNQLGDTRKSVPDLTEHLSEVEEDVSSSSSSDDREDQNPQAGAVEDQHYLYDDFKKAFDLTAIPPSTPSKFTKRQSIVSSNPVARREHPRREHKPAKRARSPTPPPHFGSRKGKAPARSSKPAVRRTRHASDDSSTLSSPPYGTPAPTPNITNRPGSNPETTTSQTQVPSSLPTLTLYKQTHTTLRVTRDSNIIGFVPLRLLTCMTMSTLFSSVIAASGHREHKEPITCLMAVFDWKDDTDVYKTIFIEKGTEGSFEIFLEIIKEAPSWMDEGARCGVAVEVVRS